MSQRQVKPARGAYVYGDFCTGEILSLSNGAQNLLLDTALSISSFGEDEAGEIYVVGLGGTVHRIINPNAPPSDPPTAAVALSVEKCRTGQTITYQTTLTPGSTLTLGDIYLGALLPDFPTRSALDSSPDRMSQAQQAKKDQMDCHNTKRINIQAVRDAKDSKFSLIDMAKALHSVG
jgi:hypothetical protein